MTLRVRDWTRHFETSESKKLKFLKWVAIPNKTDGEGYTALVDHPNAAAHLGAWYAIVETASRQDPRGTLPRGIPQDISGISRSLGRISRLPSEIFEEVLPRLIEIGWVECCQEDTESLGESARVPGESPDIPAAHNRNITETKTKTVTASAFSSPETDPPPTVADLKSKLATAATGKNLNGHRRPPASADAAEAVRKHEWTREVLIEYPGARELPGKPDDGIIKGCLHAVSGDTALLTKCLRAMHLAQKAPKTSWAWFEKVLPQYADAERRSA